MQIAGISAESRGLQGLIVLADGTLSVSEHGRVADGLLLPSLDRQGQERRLDRWDRPCYRWGSPGFRPTFRVSAALGPGRCRRSGRRRGAGAQPHRASGPELAVALLASGARQPAERIDPPSGCDGTGADVSFAERSGIGMPGNTGTHLAPHGRHPQLIADHRPLGNGYTGTNVSARHGPSAGTGLDVSPGLRAGMGRGGKDLNPGDRPFRCSGGGGFRPGPVGAHGPRGTASRLPPGVVAFAQFGKPVTHLEHAGLFWPNVGLQLSPFLGQGSAPASLFALAAWQRAHEGTPPGPCPFRR